MRFAPQLLKSSTNLPEKILVRAPNPIGDLVMATGRFDDLRRSFPASRITLMLKPGREAVVAGLDSFDDVLVDDSHFGFRRALRLVREIRRRRYDLGVILTHSLRTALVLALGRVRERVGYPRGGQGPLLTRRVPVERLPDLSQRPRPMPEIYGRLCEAAGATIGDGWPRLAIPAELEDRYRERRRELGIGDGEGLIGIVPGASFGASKLWPPASIAEVADRLTERYGLRTIILAAPGELPIVDELLSRMRTRPIDPRERPVGLDLLKPFIRDLRLLFSMDTGPRHYATALRVPTVCVMGPTHPDWTGGHLDFQEVIRHDVPCGPCHLPRCPLDHRCMREISPDEVLERIEALDQRIGVFAVSRGERGPGSGAGHAERTGDRTL